MHLHLYSIAILILNYFFFNSLFELFTRPLIVGWQLCVITHISPFALLSLEQTIVSDNGEESEKLSLKLCEKK